MDFQVVKSPRLIAPDNSHSRLEYSVPVPIVLSLRDSRAQPDKELLDRL